MAPSKFLEAEDHSRDAAFNKAMHKNSSNENGGLNAMMRKNNVAQKAAVDEYFKHWDNTDSANETEADKEARKAEYATLTRQYYNLATDLYEYGWGQSFHFCRFGYGEPFHQAQARHEHYLAHCIGIKNGMKVLDVGCGVGGPTMEIAKFTGAHITGLNNNDYQISRATRYAAKEGMSDQLNYIKGDFMQLPFPENSFDAVYAIEATCHAPTLKDVYSQIFKVLKPGGVFGVYEWLMTDKYDDKNPLHREIRFGIEQGDGIANLVGISDGLSAIKAAGFELEMHENLAKRPDKAPWYYPLAGEFKHMGTIFDFPTIARMTPRGRILTGHAFGFLETLGIAPGGTRKTADSLSRAAFNLVAGGQQDLFTPMYLMVARKPAN